MNARFVKYDCKTHPGSSSPGSRFPRTCLLLIRRDASLSLYPVSSHCAPLLVLKTPIFFSLRQQITFCHAADPMRCSLRNICVQLHQLMQAFGSGAQVVVSLDILPSLLCGGREARCRNLLSHSPHSLCCFLCSSRMTFVQLEGLQAVQPSPLSSIHGCVFFLPLRKMSGFLRERASPCLRLALHAITAGFRVSILASTFFPLRNSPALPKDLKLFFPHP